MIGIPFVYFSILLVAIYLKNKRKFDIACYIVSIFAVSGFFSLVMDVFKIRSGDTYSYSISPTAAFWYCFLITLCVTPFILYSNLKIKEISPLSNSKPIRIIAWVSFFYFILNLIMSFGDVIEALSSDLGEVRQAHAEGFGEGIWFHYMPIGLRQIFLFFNIIFCVPWVMHFMAFYCLCIQKMSMKYVWLLIGGSLTGFIQGILSAGRSGPIFWMISLGACYVFFNHFMTKRNKSYLRKFFFVLLGVLLFYVFITTVARFADNSGTSDSLIAYAGQSYINFCFFFDNFVCPYPSLKNVFPLTYYYFVDFPVKNAGQLQSLLTELTGYKLGVFYTFIGQIATSSSNLIAIIYCFVYTFVCIMVYKRNNWVNCTFRKSYFYLLGSSVLFMGLFGHYYADYPITFCVIFYSLFFLLVNNRNHVVGLKKKQN